MKLGSAQTKGLRARGLLIEVGMKLSPGRLFGIVFVTLALSGCAELGGRSHAREGNRYYIEGNYARAAKEYATAESMLPTLAVVTFNRGLACRQMMIPGAKTPENEAATRCALDAFAKLKRTRPSDPRGEQLYLQTLFDADRYDDLSKHYQSELQKNPQNLEAINALIQINTRGERWDEALKWIQRRSEVASNDAEAQYSVGVIIWNRLFQRGGAGERATFNPKADPKQAPPAFGEGDIVGEERVRLADLGISYLEKALALRPNYRDAMVYLNLLHRQKSLAYFQEPDKWQQALDQALAWQKKVQELGPPSNATPSAPASSGPPTPSSPPGGAQK